MRLGHWDDVDVDVEGDSDVVTGPWVGQPSGPRESLLVSLGTVYTHSQHHSEERATTATTTSITTPLRAGGLLISSSSSWSSNQSDIEIKTVPVRQYMEQRRVVMLITNSPQYCGGILQIPHAMKSSRTDIPRFLHLTSIGT